MTKKKVAECDNVSDYEVRQFYASHLLLGVKDAIAVSKGDSRSLGATIATANNPVLARRHCQRHSIDLRVWIGSKDFHEKCIIIDMNPDWLANCIFQILGGDETWAEKFYDAARKIGSMRSSNAQVPQTATAS